MTEAKYTLDGPDITVIRQDVWEIEKCQMLASAYSAWARHMRCQLNAGECRGLVGVDKSIQAMTDLAYHKYAEARAAMGIDPDHPEIMQ